MSHGMRLAAASDLSHLPKRQFQEAVWRLDESIRAPRVVQITFKILKY